MSELLTREPASTALGAILAPAPAPAEPIDRAAFDGFMCAVSIGPEETSPDDWLRAAMDGDTPLFGDFVEVEAALGALMRRRIAILDDLERTPPRFMPLVRLEGDAVARWSAGFMRGMRLSPSGWTALAEVEAGRAFLAPIVIHFAEAAGVDLLGETAATAAEDRASILQEAADAIPESVVALGSFWMLAAQAVEEYEDARPALRAHPKTGRNAPCPCGSGRKFKKCCGP